MADPAWTVGGPLLQCRTVLPDAQQTAGLDLLFRALQTWEAGLSRRVSRAFREFVLGQDLLASWQLEGEKYSGPQISRLTHELLDLQRPWSTQKDLVGWHHLLFPARGWEGRFRVQQVHVRETTMCGEDRICHIPPQPHHLPTLMKGWFDLQQELENQEVHRVWRAGVLGFSFVFLHPFLDGNGPMHRLVMLHQLMQGTTPRFPLPISRVLLGQQDRYHQVLDRYCRPLLDQVPHRMGREGGLAVLGETLHLYREMDLTCQLRFWQEVVEEAVRKELPGLWETFWPWYLLTDRLCRLLKEPKRRCQMLAWQLIRCEGRLSQTAIKRFGLQGVHGQVEGLAHPVLKQVPPRRLEGEPWLVFPAVPARGSEVG